MLSLKRSVCLLFAFTLTISLLSGCAKAPDAELEAAKAAIKAAQDVEADKYMAKNFQNILKALETSEAEIEKQNQTFFISRKYKTAITMLKKIKSVADELTAEAPKAKSDLIALVNENIPIAKENLVTSRKSVANAAKSKDKKAIVEELNAELSAADAILAAAIRDFESGDFLSASAGLTSVQSAVNKVTTTLKPKEDEVQVQ